MADLAEILSSYNLRRRNPGILDRRDYFSVTRIHVCVGKIKSFSYFSRCPRTHITFLPFFTTTFLWRKRYTVSRNPVRRTNPAVNTTGGFPRKIASPFLPRENQLQRSCRAGETTARNTGAVHDTFMRVHTAGHLRNRNDLTLWVETCRARKRHIDERHTPCPKSARNDCRNRANFSQSRTSPWSKVFRRC